MNADTLNLIGKPLKNNWVIERAHPSYSGATGGMHCHCYVASTDTGEEAFVKILDSTSDRSKEDSLADLKLRIDVFLYERDLIAKCKDLHMNGVVMGIDYGVPFLSDLCFSRNREPDRHHPSQCYSRAIFYHTIAEHRGHLFWPNEEYVTGNHASAH